jgi:hypothetical protein
MSGWLSFFSNKVQRPDDLSDVTDESESESYDMYDDDGDNNGNGMVIDCRRTMVSEGFLQDAKRDPAGGKTTMLDPACVGQGILVATQVGYARSATAKSPFEVGLKSRNELLRKGELVDIKGKIETELEEHEKTGRLQVNSDYPNYIYFRAPFVGKLTGNETTDLEKAESMYNCKFLTAAQMKARGKTDIEKIGYVIFIRIDPSQTYAYHQGNRSPVDHTIQRIREARKGLIKSKINVNKAINGKRYLGGEYEILLKMDILTPDWFVYQEPYYMVRLPPVKEQSAAPLYKPIGDPLEKRRQTLKLKKIKIEAAQEAEEARQKAEAAKRDALRNMPPEEKQRLLDTINNEITLITNKARPSRADGVRLVELEQQKRNLGFQGGGRRRRTHKQRR